MVRRPTPDPLAFHRAALAGLKPEIHADDVQAGWYTRRMVRGGVRVPVEIKLIQIIDPEIGELLEDERFEATVDGEPANVTNIWTYCASNPISREEFEFMSKDAAWCRVHAPNDPKTRVMAPVDLNEMPPLF